jgi:hypothetical protein
VDRLDLQLAQVLNCLPLSPDAAEMGVKAIVPRARRLSVGHHVLVLLQVDALVTFRAEENLRTHRSILDPYPCSA